MHTIGLHKARCCGLGCLARCSTLPGADRLLSKAKEKHAGLYLWKAVSLSSSGSVAMMLLIASISACMVACASSLYSKEHNSLSECTG